MKTKKDKLIKTTLLIVGILILPLLKLYAEDLRRVASLSGYWKFSVGDNEAWIDPKFDDSNWDEIRVQQNWESQGYDGYNGYAWYRKSFTFSSFPGNQQMYLVLGNIDDCDEVYLNGTLIGKSGSFPPDYSTAYGIERKYPISAHILNPAGNNLLAVRVYDGIQDGGIVGGRLGIFIDEDIDFLNHNLTGHWKFKLGNNREWSSPDFNDNNWAEVNVPASWESQGYADYDGYAWYRKEFRLPSSLANQELYLSLGKIDDYDVVYVNGKLIGEVYDLRKDGDYRHNGYEFNARRVYRIPDNLLSSNGMNIIAVRVYDEQQRGGIYEGPIGLMDEENYRDYMRKHRDSRSFWDYIIDVFSE